MENQSSIFVLVADDEDMFRNLVMEMLRLNDFQCEAANDADSALTWFEKRAIDIFVCDIKMPGNEQLQLVRTIQERWPATKTILMTGFPTVDSAVASLRLTVSDYLIKPFTAKDLVAAIKKSLAPSSVDHLIRRTHQQIHEWADALQYMSHGDKGALSEQEKMQRFFSITLKNMSGCIADLHTASLMQPGHQAGVPTTDPCRYFNCTRYAGMNELLRHTIAVLDNTRRSFKSKELQLLREKLQEELSKMDVNSTFPSNQ